MEENVALLAHRVARRFHEWRQLVDGDSINAQRVSQAWHDLLAADERFIELVGEFAEKPGGCGCPDDED